jgi:MarR family transcriptional regulator, 2-MHQ and catechol-resistance regulon repressor
MRNELIGNVIRDLLSITPLIRRNVQRKLVKTAFTQIDQNISPAHLDIMKILQNEGVLHIAEIGERLQIQKPQMTYLIDRLEQFGMVTRQPAPSDRRVTNVALTDEGCRILKEFDCAILSTVEEKLSHLSESELEDISVSLRKIGDLFAQLNSESS